MKSLTKVNKLTGYTTRTPSCAMGGRVSTPPVQLVRRSFVAAGRWGDLVRSLKAGSSTLVVSDTAIHESCVKSKIAQRDLNRERKKSSWSVQQNVGLAGAAHHSPRPAPLGRRRFISVALGVPEGFRLAIGPGQDGRWLRLPTYRAAPSDAP